MRGVVIIGSGASAVQAAARLVEAGVDVLMLDVGKTDDVYTESIPARSFETIRRTDAEQHRYFLGDNFEGIPFGDVRVGAQLTPPRRHLSASDTPLTTEDFEAVESHALGGLAAGWGAATPHYTAEDMAGWPITRRELQPHYDAVTERVGICGTDDDDLAEYFGDSAGLLPPPRPDSNGLEILSRYRRHRALLHGRGLRIGAPRLAMATREFRGRGPLRYLDMEFWADKDRAVYRPGYTVEELQRFPNFEYRRNARVVRFEERGEGGVLVEGVDIAERTRFEVECRRLVVGAGAIATTRIVLESLRLYNLRVPMLSNPYTYYPCFVYTRLGKTTRGRRHSLTQLMMYFRPGGSAPLLQVQVYSYRSLLTFKLVKESPLPRRESIAIMRIMQPYFIIAGVHHEDRPGSGKAAWLEPSADGGESVLRIDYCPGKRELERRRESERRLMRNFRLLGCLPIKRIDPGDGASIHYGGTFPMSIEDRPLTTRHDGSLRGVPNVYLVDGSVFPHLPAKGLTFTAMANADRIAAGIANQMSSNVSINSI